MMNMNNIQEKYFSFQGRLNRWAYIKRIFIVSLAVALINLTITIIFGASNGGGSGSAVTGALTKVISFISWLSSITLMTKRLHDLNKSGWWQVIFQVPSVVAIFAMIILAIAIPGQDLGLGLIGTAILGVAALVSIGMALWTLFCKGTTGDNQYGPDPLAKENKDATNI